MWVSVSFFVLCFRKKGTDRLKRCKTAETLLVKSINYTRSKKMKDKIFSVLQRVGRSFMLPIAILPVAGLLLGIGSSFTNATTIETYGLTRLLGNGTILHALLVIMNKVGSAVFDNLPLIFAVGVAIGMAKKEKEVALALTDKEKQIGVAQADRDRAAVIAKTLADKESAIARSKAELEVNKAEAERMEEVGKNKAEADKQAAIAIQDSEAQIKKAEAEKNASVGYNNAQKEVAISESELQVIKAQSEKRAGEERVKSEAAVKTAKELADKEVEEAKAEKVQAALRAEKIVPAETQKQEAILQADAEAEKIKRRAAAEAAANLAKAEAEAKAIKMKLEAEAEGKKKSLMAEAEGFKAMVEAAESNPQIAIQYKMVNQWKEIAGEQVKAFEHINLGNITVFDGGQNSTGNFLNNVVKTVAPALGVIDQLPIADTLKKLKGDDKK